MAEIPIEKKGGMPWWIWLVLLLLVAAIAWFLLSDDEVEVAKNEVVAEQVEMTSPVANADGEGPIDTLTSLMAAPLATMVGQNVAFDAVPVESVTGDMAFYIGENVQSRAYVVFDEVKTPNLAKEGKVDVNSGSQVAITGNIMSSETPMPEGVNAVIPEGVDAYIFAETIDVVN